MSRRAAGSPPERSNPNGAAVGPQAVRRELATGQYDAITIIHNEPPAADD